MKTAQPEEKSFFFESPWALGVLIILTLLIFSRALGMGYVVWDDNVMIQENLMLRAPFNEAWSLFWTRFYHGDYLPVTWLSYWIERRLFGEQPQVGHAINLGLHAMNVGLLWMLLRRWSFSAAAAWGVAACFAWHPLQAESVYWLSERKGLLSTLFLFLAVLWSQRAVEFRGWKARAGYWICYALSFLAKATGVLLPVWLAVWEREKEKRSWREILKLHFPALLLGALGSIVRIAAYRASVPGLADRGFSWEHWLRWPLQVFAAIEFYVEKFFIPWRLSIIYPPFSVEGMKNGAAIFMGGLVVALIGYGCWRRSTVVRIWGAWTALFLLPVLQIIPRINFVNDRYFYIPIVGVAVLLIHVFNVQRISFLRRGILGLLLLLWSALSFLRADVWASNAALWKDTVEKSPWSGIAHNNWAQELQKEGHLEAAIAEYQKVLELGRSDGTDNLAYNNLAIIYSSTESGPWFDLKKAEDLLSVGIQRSPRPEESFTLRFNLALVLFQQNRALEGRDQLLELRRLLWESRNERYAGLLQRVEALLQKMK